MNFIFIDNILNFNINTIKSSFKKYINNINNICGVSNDTFIIKTILNETLTVQQVNKFNKFNQIEYVDYDNKYIPFAIGIYSTCDFTINIDILDTKYIINKYDIIWFPLTWTMPFKEYVNDANDDDYVNTFKVIMYSNFNFS